jgi:GMP synthase (glutamine-hydrolysing)
MTRSLYILVTGEPLPVMRELRGSFGALIREATGDAWPGHFRDVDGQGGDELPAPADIAGLVITGSAASVTSREPWMLRLEDYLRHVVHAGTPTLGICFGHQLLAQALGGLVAKNPQGREIGTVAVQSLERDPLVTADKSEFLANMTHVDVVVELPPGTRVIGRTELDRHAALRFAERVYGVQFHPEIDAEVMLHYVSSRRQLLVDEGIDAEAIRATVSESPDSAAILRRFAGWVREVAGKP